MNYFDHHIGDYDADTAHLSWLEDMAYTRLMRLYYRREKPIPSDLKDACRLVRAASKEQQKAVADVLAEFFRLEADGWHQQRCDSEIAVYQKKVAHNQEVGKLGGRPRKVKTQEEPRNNQSGFILEPRNNPPQTPDPRPQAKHSEPIGSGGTPPPTDIERVWANGVPLLTAAGVKESNARSMLGGLCKTHGPAAVADAVQRCADQCAIAPVSWLQAALKSKPGQNSQEALEASNKAVVARFLEKESHASQ